MRINRYLASAGLGSRRKCEKLISEGKVQLNGNVVTALSTLIEKGDSVQVEGRVVRLHSLKYFLLYKPRGIVCSLSDERGRACIADLLPLRSERLFHVGRLDLESEGLLLLTNDGSLAQRLMHPSYHIEKEYEVVLDKPFDVQLLPQLCKGFFLPEGRAYAKKAFMLRPQKLKIVLCQGLKRQIRRMFERLGYSVKRLVRVRIGGLGIGNLKPGYWRNLTSHEVEILQVMLRSAP